MDVFSLTETEFFRKLTYGENDNLHIAYKEFVLQVSELCNKEPHKGCVISAFSFVEGEISPLHMAAQRQEVNDALVAFIAGDTKTIEAREQVLDGISALVDPSKKKA